MSLNYRTHEASFSSNISAHNLAFSCHLAALCGFIPFFHLCQRIQSSLYIVMIHFVDTSSAMLKELLQKIYKTFNSLC